MPYARRRAWLCHVNEVPGQRPAVPGVHLPSAGNGPPPGTCRTFHLYEDEQLHVKRLSRAERLLSEAHPGEALVGKGFCRGDMSLLTSAYETRTLKSSSEKRKDAGHVGGITSGTAWTPLEITCPRRSSKAPAVTT